MLLALATRSFPPRPPPAACLFVAALSTAFAFTAQAREPEGPAPVVLVRGTRTELDDPGGEGPSAARAARLVSAALTRAGVPFEAIGDDEAAAGALGGHIVAILPYNPRPSPGEREALAEFVGGGGGLIVFYVADRSLWGALGIVKAKVRPRSRRGEFAEMRFVPGLRDDGGALSFLPAALFQDSWNVLEVEPAAGAKVLARWHDDQGRPSGSGRGLPAVLRGPGGVFFTHVMLGAATEAKSLACLALAAELAGPAVLEPAARAKLAAARDVPAWRGLAGIAELARAAALSSSRGADRGRLIAALEDAARAEREGKAALEVGAYAEALGQAMLCERKAREAAALALPARDGEVRAIWVRNPETVVWSDVAPRLAEAGLNAVLPNYVRGLRAAYPSRILQTPREVPRGSSLETCIRECRRVGIEVHVWWTVLFLDDTPRGPVDDLGRQGRLVVDGEGRTVSKATSGWLCPSNGRNIDLLGDVARELARRFSPEGLHLDYVRLPQERSCLCEACREGFKASENWPGEALPGGARAGEFRRFRRGRVTAAVERIARAAREVRTGIYVSAAVFPELPMCRETLAQDWGDWVARGLVDLVMPMDYTDSAGELDRWVREQGRRLGARVPLVPGIGLAAGRVRIGDPAELVRQIAVARAAGADGYAIFQLDEEFLKRHIGLLAGGPGRTGSGVRPHGGPALLWQLPRGVDPGAIPAGSNLEIRLHTGLRSRSGLAVRAFEGGAAADRSGAVGPKVQIESASGSLISELGPGPAPGRTVRLPVVAPAGPFRIVVRGLVEVEGRGRRPVALRSPLYTGITEAERAAEIARSRPTGTGPKVAVLTGGYGSRGILAALRRSGSLAAYPIRSTSDLARKAGARPDVLVLTQRRDPEELDSRARAAVRRFVESGGGVLLTHDAVGQRFHPVLFGEIAEGAARRRRSRVVPVEGKRLAAMIGPAAVEHAHFDHVILRPGPAAEVVAVEGEEGDEAVIAWGPVGEGRVVACGIAIGIDRDERERAPKGREAELLLALVKHLAGKAKE